MEVLLKLAIDVIGQHKATEVCLPTIKNLARLVCSSMATSGAHNRPAKHVHVYESFDSSYTHSKPAMLLILVTHTSLIILSCTN